MVWGLCCAATNVEGCGTKGKFTLSAGRVGLIQHTSVTVQGENKIVNGSEITFTGITIDKASMDRTGNGRQRLGVNNGW